MYCVAELDPPGSENFDHMRIDASGKPTYLGTEDALLAEMNGFQPTSPLNQCPPLFKMRSGHWSLHLPQGTYSDTKRSKASKKWFYHLFS